MSWVRSPRTGGMFLVVGAVMFGLFWWAPASAGDPVFAVGPWPLQLAFHGVSMAFTTVGLASFVASSGLTDRPRSWSQVGVGCVAVGMLLSHVLMVAGLVIVGVVQLRDRHPFAGGSMIAGGSLWAAVFAAGGSIGNEDNPPLDGVLRLVAMSGLALIVVGLLIPGISQSRQSTLDLDAPTALVV